ncbi:MAG TPA: ATP synthase F1 subunit gamma [bacterium]|nr:ATP synthase F1 subunit gamma [bacterium]
MSNTRDIKRRIKSINNTKKITKAMELVSAAKMRKAVAQVVVSRQYALKTWQIIQSISNSNVSYQHPLLKQHPNVKRVAVLAISSNRGLCGGFNTSLVRLAHQAAQNFTKDNIKYEFITFGKVAAEEIKKLHHPIVANFDKPDLMQNIVTIDPITKILLEGFVTKKYQQIKLLYTDYQSSMRQIPVIKTLLPLSTSIDQDLGDVGQSPENSPTENIFFEYKFEPSPAKVLDQILPRILELQIYQACLESDASEHSARMMAMRNAYNAASDVIDELSLAYNKARQTAITQEIAEIVAGANSI